MGKVIYFAMTKRPEEDDSDTSFSKTVLLYDNLLRFIGLGYFDFEQDDWSLFTDNKSLLKCWCYVPHPTGNSDIGLWETVRSKGYNKFL